MATSFPEITPCQSRTVLAGRTRIEHVVRVEPGTLVVRALRVDPELDGPGDPVREVGARAVREGQVFAAVGRVGPGIVGLDERTGSPHQVQAHQVPPIVGVRAYLEGGERTRRDLKPAK